MWNNTPTLPSPAQGFIAGHDKMFSGKPFGQRRSSPKNLQPTCRRAGGRGGTESKNLDKTSPAAIQDPGCLWASPKGNYFHPSQTQHKQGRLAGQPQTCLQQSLLGLFWTLDGQTSNSLQQPEHKSVAWKGSEFQIMPTDLMIRSITRWRLWIWNFTKTLHGILKSPEKKNAPHNALSKRAQETDLKHIAWSEKCLIQRIVCENVSPEVSTGVCSSHLLCVPCVWVISAQDFQRVSDESLLLQVQIQSLLHITTYFHLNNPRLLGIYSTT